MMVMCYLSFKLVCDYKSRHMLGSTNKCSSDITKFYKWFIKCLRLTQQGCRIEDNCEHGEFLSWMTACVKMHTNYCDSQSMATEQSSELVSGVLETESQLQLNKTLLRLYTNLQYLLLWPIILQSFLQQKFHFSNRLKLEITWKSNTDTNNN